MSFKKRMSSPGDVVLQLQQAQDIASIRAALLAATPFSTEDASVQAEVQRAETRLERVVRLAKLTPPITTSAPLTPAREQSHRQRMHLLMESRLKQSLISMGAAIDLSTTHKLMKDSCHDDRCTDCSQSAEFQSVCLQFTLECIAVRMSTRLDWNSRNGFEISASTREFMEAYVADPVRTWLDHPQRLYSLGTELDVAYDTAVLPTEDGTKARRDEIKQFRRHVDSLKKMILNLQACDRADPN